MAAGIKVISTITELRRTGNQLGIFTYFGDPVDFLRFFIADTFGNLDGIDYLEGDLVEQFSGVEDQFFITEDGDLIVVGVDVAGYEINENGDLILNQDNGS